MWWKPNVSPHQVQIKGCASPIYRVNIQVLSLYSRRPIPVWLYGFMAEYRQYRQYQINDQSITCVKCVVLNKQFVCQLWRAHGASRTTGARRLDFFFFFFSFFFFFCIFTRLETLAICSCNYFTFKTFSINPQSTLVYGLLYRQGRKRGVLVLLGSWDSPHLKLKLHHLPLFQCWLSTHGCLCKRSRPLPSFKISTTARKN